MDLSVLNSEDGYRQYFMGLSLWVAPVQRICRRHLFTPARQVRPGLAGTYPTFIVDDHWVIKFFGRLFEGERSFKAELQAGLLLQQDPFIPAPEFCCPRHDRCSAAPL